MTARGLADTSVLIARETGRRLQADRMPDELAISVITLGELRAGVLSGRSSDDRARRLDTLERAMTLDVMPVDVEVASAWAGLRAKLREGGRRMPVNDSWIAATALANGLPVVTQDADYDGVPGLTVIKV